MSNEHILLILNNSETAQLLERAALAPAGYRVSNVPEWGAAEKVFEIDMPDLVIVDDAFKGQERGALEHILFERYPFIPFLWLPKTHIDGQAVEAIQLGFAGYLPPPLRASEVQDMVGRALERRMHLLNQIRLAARRDTSSLRKRVDGLETIEKVGRKVTSTLDLDSVLMAVVDAAVEMAGAEEGSLLLLDETSGELYMRASRNFQQEFASTFRMPVHDSLVAQVVRTGQALVIDEETPRKIKTSYLVHTIVYAPLIVHGRVIGVLEVDNRQSRKSFSEYQVKTLSTLADYAAIAIENARLYARSELERNKLESILTGIEEAVIVVDNDRRIVLINHRACEAFNIQEQSPIGKRAREVINHQDLLEILRDTTQSSPSRVELSLVDGRVLNAQITPIPGIGLVVTMQDITHLKELDRIKTDFVNTVSHDLRSPLTAILGYVELLDRVGAVNEQQKEFIRRVQISVQNITALINDLLDLGRIEAGFDVRKEVVPLAAIISYAVDSLRGRATEKSQQLTVEVAEDLPQVLGNPVRLRQMLNNLLTNAIKYTPPSGQLTVSARAEGGQIILQVTDNGPGIPPADQPYIFDKFYRASNTPLDTPGTGLGLAIVKSIAENHLGRVWVESALGQGTTFTIVLPTIDHSL
jgi:two-component system phosphate regulon sensor histidine kinase PhoR